MAEPPRPDPTRAAWRIVLAWLVGTVAFWAYTRTLLPGVDLGDTGGFQAAVLWPEVSARQAYPLYYNLARPFVLAIGPDSPARALNLFSAVCAATAVGLVTWLAAAIARSMAAGVASGVLLAFSYTFWSQAIIAEVYPLHLALITACLIALASYAAKPTRLRLFVFFAIYAGAFGNHLSMILFLPPFTLFLLLVIPDRRELFRPSVVAMAIGVACAGALQYWPNFASVAFANDAPPAWRDRVAAFWFDTTKADWREEMVFGIQSSQAGDRLAMWWFDARQQFGIPGIALAIAGAVRLLLQAPRWGLTFVTAFVTTTAFALTYNVGDTHVFFLPGHLLTALCAGASLMPAGAYPPFAVVRGFRRRTAGFAFSILFAAAVIGYGAWRGWSTWPAVDRHDDRRGEQLIARLTLGISDPDAMLVSQMNWQLENVLLYMARHQRPDLTWTRVADVLPHFPFFVEDQRGIGRDVVMSAGAAAATVEAYGPAFPLVADGPAPLLSLSDEASRIPRGAPYVLSLLTPPRDEQLDEEDLARAIGVLTGGQPPERRPGHFEVMAGITGEAPATYRSSDRPFTMTVPAGAEDASFTVRMDSWLPSDTFRRPGFGHVLLGRSHVQILERGVNLVWLGRDGRAAPPIYAASLFAPQPRFRLPVAPAPAFALRVRPGV